jgi:hypothetical protein
MITPQIQALPNQLALSRRKLYGMIRIAGGGEIDLIATLSQVSLGLGLGYGGVEIGSATGA